MNEEVKRYLDAIPKERKSLFNKLQKLIKSMYPDVEVLMWYRMPTYKAKSGWVALANQKHYVSLYTNGAHNIAEFMKKYPKMKTGTGCINFRDTDPFPVAAIRNVIRKAIEQR